MWICMCIHPHTHIHTQLNTYTSLLSSLSSPAITDTPVAISTLGTVFKYQTLSNKRNLSTFEKWLHLGLGQEENQMNLEPFIILQIRKFSKNEGDMLKEYKGQLKEVHTGPVQDKFNINIYNNRNLSEPTKIVIRGFIFFLGGVPNLQHMEAPRLGSNQSCSCQPISQPQQCQIQAASVTYIAACCNTDP